MSAKSIKDEYPQMMKAESFEESEEIISFAGESKDDSINDGNMANAENYKSREYTADAVTTDSARSFVKRNSSGTETNNLETDSIKTIYLTLEIKNVVLENENVKLSIIDSGAELIKKEKCAENEILLYAKVPNQIYDAFIAELENKYGEEKLATIKL
jgi:RecA/RadA recombinase